MSLTTRKVLRLGSWAAQSARALVPYSSNRPDINQQHPHRVLQLVAARASRSPLRTDVRSWNVDVRSPNARADLTTAQHVRTTIPQGMIPDLNGPGGNLHAPIINPTVRQVIVALGADARSKPDPLRDAELNAKNAVRLRIGNCGETSALAYLLLMEYPTKGDYRRQLPSLDGEELWVERVYVLYPQDNHAFLVLGRDRSVPLSEMKRWGPRAVICDAWTNEAYVVEEALRKNRGGEFQKIRSSCASMHSIIRGVVGSGHSQRWKNKPRVDFINRRPVRRQAEAVPRVP